MSDIDSFAGGAAVEALAGTPDGELLGVSSRGLFQQPLAGGEAVCVEPLARTAVAVGPDGRAYVGLGSDEHSTVGLGVIDLQCGGTTRLDSDFEEDGLLCLDVARDGTLAIGGDFIVELREPSGALRSHLKCDKWPYVLRFSPDGEHLFVGSWSGCAWLLDVAKVPRARARDWTSLDSLGKAAVELPRHAGPIMDARFLADGRIAIAATGGSDQGRLLLWNPRTPRDSESTDLPAGANAVAILPDGVGLAVGDLDGTLHIVAIPARGKALAPPRRSFRLPGGDAPGRHTVRTFYQARRATTIHCMAVVGETLALGLDGGDIHRVPMGTPARRRG